MKPCTRHPKYRANKAPTNGCFECAAYYLARKGVRKPLAKPGQSFRSDKDYRRQSKHRKSWDE